MGGKWKMGTNNVHSKKQNIKNFFSDNFNLNKFLAKIIVIFLYLNILLLTLSETYIPGLKDKYNSSDAINKIMEKKREKLTTMEDEKKKIKEKKIAWNKIREKSGSLQSFSKKLYGFESPFDNKICKSSNEEAFSAIVTKYVDVGEYKIKILNIAKAHKIASKSLDKNYKIPEGTYNFKIGKENVSIKFEGGMLDDFASEIKKDSKEYLKAYITKDTSKTQVLILESGKTGEKNYISLIDDKTKKIFKEMDFIEDVISYIKEFIINKSNLTSLSKIKKDPFFKNNNILIIDRRESYKYTLPEKIPFKDRLIMEIDMGLEIIDPNKEPEEPTGPDFFKSGDLDLFDIDVEGESTLVDIPKYEKKTELPEKIEDDHYLEIITNNRTIKLNPLELMTTSKTIKFNMYEMINNNETIEAIILKNNNTFKKLNIGKIKFYDENSTEGVRYKHEISKPEDAVIVMDGIKIKRESNTIEDLIKGLTLYIYETTQKEETLKIDRDYESMIKTITEFLGEFNQFIDIVNNEIDVVPNAEGEKGNFSGDYSLVSLISKLRIIMMNPHITSYGDELSLLAQIGISTNASGNGNLDKTKLKGILEVKEELFIEKMDKYPVGVKELFGKDTDGDLIIDTGAAYEVDSLLKLYNSKGNGYFDVKNVDFDQKIKDKDKQIKEYEDQLVKEEKKLKKDFYEMEKSANELEESKKKFDNLYNNNK